MECNLKDKRYRKFMEMYILLIKEARANYEASIALSIDLTDHEYRRQWKRYTRNMDRIEKKMTLIEDFLEKMESRIIQDKPVHNRGESK